MSDLIICVRLHKFRNCRHSYLHTFVFVIAGECSGTKITGQIDFRRHNRAIQYVIQALCGQGVLVGVSAYSGSFQFCYFGLITAECLSEIALLFVSEFTEF